MVPCLVSQDFSPRFICIVFIYIHGVDEIREYCRRALYIATISSRIPLWMMGDALRGLAWIQLGGGGLWATLMHFVLPVGREREGGGGRFKGRAGFGSSSR